MKPALPSVLRSVTRPLPRALLLALIAACSESHGPQAGDTATSWLRACADDGECGRGQRCLAHVCSLPCTARADACGVIAAEARCVEQGSAAMCDVPCTEDGACSQLGTGYECVEARCRAQGTAALATQTLALEHQEQDPAAWLVRPPVVTWSGERWLVAHQALTLDGKNQSVRQIWEVDRDGATRSRPPPRDRDLRVDVPESTRPDAIGPDGTLVTRFYDPGLHGLGLLSSSPVEFRFLLANAEQRPALYYGDAQLVPLAQSSDWLVLSWDETGQARLGRYDPYAQRWTVAERDLTGSTLSTPFPRLIVAGDDVLVTRERSTEVLEVARFVGLAGQAPAANAAERWLPLNAAPLRPDGEPGHFSWHEASGGWVVPIWTHENHQGGNLSTTVPQQFHQRPTGFRIGADTIEAGVSFRLSGSEQAKLQGWAGLPERDAIAFCHVERDASDERDELWLSLFDASGGRVWGPSRLASSMHELEACQLSWSGAALLAVWLEEDRQGSSQLYARLIDVR
jgi:hypothetical protein